MRARTAFLIAALLVFSSGGMLMQTVSRMSDGIWRYIRPDGQWYDSLAGAAVNGCLAGCLISYAIKKQRRDRLGITPSPRPWRRRWEARIAIYTLAAGPILAIPMEALDTVLKMRSVQMHDSFASEFHYSYFIYWIFAAGLIGYDRWLVHQDVNFPDPDHCIHCGYDLRATPERCPECGTVVEVSRSTTAQSASDSVTHG